MPKKLNGFEVLEKRRKSVGGRVQAQNPMYRGMGKPPSKEGKQAALFFVLCLPLGSSLPPADEWMARFYDFLLGNDCPDHCDSEGCRCAK